jgi:hypothetical protein
MNNNISNRKKLLYNQHVKKVQDFISQKFESPKAAISDISDDTVKNHKKRKRIIIKSRKALDKNPLKTLIFYQLKCEHDTNNLKITDKVHPISKQV